MKIGTPRIIGILLIIIATLVYFTGSNGYIGLSISGLILIIASAHYTQKILDLFIETVSNWKILFVTALYDAIYWLLVFGSVYFFKWRLQAKTAAAQAGTTLTKEAMTNPDLVAKNAAMLQQFVIFLTVGGLLLLVFCFLAYTFSRGFIWTTITKQKADKKFFKRWLGVNFFWWIIWTPIFLLVMLAMKNNPLAKGSIAMLLFVASYFTPIMHTLYMQTHKIGTSLANGLGWGLSKLHLLIVPYTYAFVAYVIAFQLFRLAQNTTVVQPISMLFVVLFMSWMRIYLYHIIKQFK
jgi:hypothetical protein